MKKALTKNKNMTMGDLAGTIDNLAGMVARGFDKIDERFDKVEKDIAEVKENLATTRMDVLGIGDRFVSKHEFSQHLIRFSLLEEKVKTKK